ncbi:MAG TPA: glycine betaine ABC transporter substrate-binding protein [Burkholderiales bacterium]|nr:glycine betaine ABC transporter substrate-binding protein [Burkholderiales bacterium]
MRGLWILMLVPLACAAQDAIQVGSKRFTESYILGEIATQAVNASPGGGAVHRRGLGNTSLLFAALESGAIDVYPEYTGTVTFELLGLTRPQSIEELNRHLRPRGIAAGVPLGFNNSYALAMRGERAEALAIRRISDLARHPRLTFGLSQEFLNRRDGWPALRSEYGLPGGSVRGLDHGLAYEAIASGHVEVIDAYTTDAKIVRYRLRVLRDDRNFFPAYDAILLYRLDLPRRSPAAWKALQGLEGRITEANMTAMNAAAELSGRAFSSIAGDFLAGEQVRGGAGRKRGLFEAVFAGDFWRLTWEHSVLVFGSLALSVVLGVPLGIVAQRSSRLRHLILGAAGVLQTVPALALLAFLIAALEQIGTVPAIIALFLYALLPIVRNTYTGLAEITPSMRESAVALGLGRMAQLSLIELPLAARSIVAGIKTSAVINVGTATIAAFIGAGGYGERIVAGLAVNDNITLLAGAIPAAAMALVVQAGFDALDRIVVPRGLRIREGRSRLLIP